MHIISGLDDIGWHDLASSGAYEWWYVDALSDDGRTAFVFIWFAGLPFSPDYLTDHERSRAPHPLEHVAMFAAVYRDGRQICYALNRHERSDFEASRMGLDVRVGSSTIALKGGTILAGLDLPLMLGGSRLEGELAFAPDVPPAAIDFGRGTEGADHTWNPVAPGCRVTGRIAVVDSNGTTTAIPFEGRGYHDHNYGTKPLTEGIDRWFWGRVHLGPRTIVYYHNELTNEPSESVVGLLEPDARMLHTDDVRFRVTGWSWRPMCPRYPTGLELECALSTRRLTLSATLSRILDWGPFYMRFLMRFVAEIDGETHEATGITEYLRPHGLRRRLYRPLIKTRISRIPAP